ncbi:MAG TPA: hypothetical protein VG603_04295, partial [Chitinophagales bacterium]|nr:hypothetical protein [Chitinophagales bacterium]
MKNLFNRSPFFIRLLNWEYWPFYVVHAPVFAYYLWLSLKARSLFYYSASNPSIKTGGMFGESKWEIFELMPESILPKTVIARENYSVAEIESTLVKKGMDYPLIAKPDRGERGWKVNK